VWGLRVQPPAEEHDAVDKAPDAFRTISEVADELDIPQHVLRFWESRFPQIKPMKRAGGRRYYRPDDVDLLRGIKYLLYGEGYTIRGVQRILREQGPKIVQAVWQPGAAQPAVLPDEDVPEQAEQLAPDDAARALFGLLQAPSIPRTEDETDTTTFEVAVSAVPVAVPPAAAQLTRDNVRRLQSALHELRECRRLIDEALKDEAA
jgi:DNA-binding transcriptional MerR regulator